MKRLMQFATPVGLALLVIGSGWGVLASRVTPAVYQGLLVIGAVLLAAGLWSDRARLLNPVGGKRARYGANFLASALIGVMIVLLVNFLAVRYRERWDLTTHRINSLHPATIRVLEGIERDVDLFAFFPERNPEFRAVRQLYDQFAFHQPRIAVTVADPNKRPDLVEQLGVQGNEMTVVKAGDRLSFFPGRDEATLAAALREVTRENPQVVYWMVGHGERGVEAPSGEGYQRLEGDLVKSFMTVKTFSLGLGGSIPEDASVVVIADPREALRDDQIDELDRYLEDGGRLLVLADLRLDEEAPHPLAKLFDRWGLRASDAVLVDPRREKRTEYPNLLTATPDAFGGHEVVESLRGKHLVMRTARPLEFFQVLEDQQIFHHVLVRAGRGTYPEPNREEFRQKSAVDPALQATFRDNPPVVALLAYREYGVAEDGTLKKEARLVLVGDADFAKDEYYDRAANGEFVRNLVNWLKGDEVFIRREGEETYAKAAMALGPDSRRLVRLVFMIEAAFVFLLGWVVWFVRKTK
jgi:ABC-type uncharacterized transport system involved in gliding motility auxiliary subunit